MSSGAVLSLEWRRCSASAASTHRIRSARAHDERQRLGPLVGGGGRIVEFQHLVRLVELGVFIDARCEVVASIILRVLCGGGRRRRSGSRARVAARTSQLSHRTFAQLDLRLLLLKLSKEAAAPSDGDRRVGRRAQQGERTRQRVDANKTIM